MKLIALTGLPRSGKDTIAEYLGRRYGYARLAFADPLKKAASVLLGRPLSEMEGADGFDREAVLPEWGFTTRWFLQVLGTECLREQVRPDFWVQRMRNTIQNQRVLGVSSRFVITDCRFPNEVEMVHSLSGVVVEVTRPGTVASVHRSDWGVTADITLANSGGVLDLHSAVDDLVNNYGFA